VNTGCLAASGAYKSVRKLDDVIAEMKESGFKMNADYKETSKGGCARNYGLNAAAGRDTSFAGDKFAGEGEKDIKDYYR